MRALDLVLIAEKTILSNSGFRVLASQNPQKFAQSDYKYLKGCHVEVNNSCIKITKGWTFPYRVEQLFTTIENGYWVFSFVGEPFNYFEYKRFRTVFGAFLLYRYLKKTNVPVGILVFKVKRSEFKVCCMKWLKK